MSYNCVAQKYARCRETVHKSPLISASLMLVGAACFILLPVFWLLSLIGLNYTWLRLSHAKKSHRVRGAAAPRIRFYPFFTAACTS